MFRSRSIGHRLGSVPEPEYRAQVRKWSVAGVGHRLGSVPEPEYRAQVRQCSGAGV